MTEQKMMSEVLQTFLTVRENFLNFSSAHWDPLEMRYTLGEKGMRNGSEATPRYGRVREERVAGKESGVSAIECRGLTKAYRGRRVVRDFSMTVEAGDIYGFVGRNGAGKSTLLKVISGILKPTTGSVQVNGTIVPMLELGSGFDFDLTGRENVFLNGAILGYSEQFLKGKYKEIAEFSELGQFIDVPLRNYSSGMVMRLAFSIATVVQPDILIVDEILAVGDAAFQEKSKKRMLELMGGGTTVLFVSHSLSQIREMCSKAIWLDHGEMVMAGTTAQICDAYAHYAH